MTPQHLEALNHANEVRLAQAKLRRRVGAGRLSILKALEDPIALHVTSRSRNGMGVARLLGAQPRWGRERTRKFLARLGIAESRPVGLLTERQRQLIRDGLKRR